MPKQLHESHTFSLLEIPIKVLGSALHSSNSPYKVTQKFVAVKREMEASPVHITYNATFMINDDQFAFNLSNGKKVYFSCSCFCRFYHRFVWLSGNISESGIN